MFDISWFWLFFILWYHFRNVIFSLYMHRGIGHQQLSFSNNFAHFCRFWLWVGKFTGPLYAETYYVRHTDHHRYADTKKDPHSPYHMTVRELLKPWKYDLKTLSKSPVKTPTDWIQQKIYDPYRFHGKWILFLIAGILFGPWGFVLAWLIDTLTEPWVGILVGGWVFHKIGFTYEKSKNSTVKARNVFPIGFLFAGEELHANHHNDPNTINYRKKWFEVDTGYMYAVIFKYFGWVKFNEHAVRKNKK